MKKQIITILILLTSAFAFGQFTPAQNSALKFKLDSTVKASIRTIIFRDAVIKQSADKKTDTVIFQKVIISDSLVLDLMQKNAQLYNNLKLANEVYLKMLAELERQQEYWNGIGHGITWNSKLLGEFLNSIKQ